MTLSTFTKTGVTTYTFPKGTALPFSQPITPNQIIGVTGGGSIKVANLGDAEQQFIIALNRVTKTERDNLLAFIQDANINYSQYTFTYTDEHSVARTVRFWETEGLDFPQVSGGLYNINIILREEI